LPDVLLTPLFLLLRNYIVPDKPYSQPSDTETHVVADADPKKLEDLSVIRRLMKVLKLSSKI